MLNREIEGLESRRLFAAGDPLDSFGHHGQALTPYESYTVALSDLKPTPDGKLLASVASQDPLLDRPGVKTSFVRYNADGSPDTTFGGVGAMGSFFTTVRRITVRSDGKFYALGSDRGPRADGRSQGFSVTSASTWYIARFKANGTLDRSFGIRGKIALHLPTNVAEDESTGGAANTSSFIDADGRLTLLADYNASRTAGSTEPGVFRFDATGRLDPAFNGGAPLRLRTAVDRLSNASIALSNTGQLVVIGDRGFRHRNTTVVLYLTDQGTRDPAFNGDGVTTVSTDSLFNPLAAFSADGHLFVAGTKYTSGSGASSYKAHIYKYNADGSTDTTFAGGDVAYDDSVGPVTPAPDGGVVVGFGGLHYFHANGTQDAAFEGVDLSSVMNVVVGRAVYGVRLSPDYALNKQGKPVYRNAVLAVALDGNGPSPLAVSNKHVTFNGTSADDDLEVDVGPDVEGRAVTYVDFMRDTWWTRTLPISAVTSITVDGDQGSDGIRVFAHAAANLNLPITLNGGAGNDYLTGYGKASSFTANGGAGTDHVGGDITHDSNAQ